MSVNPLATEFPAIYLYLTVLDDGGNAVTNLTQNDFYVWEQASGESNAVAEAITSFGETSGGGAGISFSLVFDVSGSMAGTPLADAKQAAISFLANTAASDRGNLVQFSSYNEVSLVLASDWVTADADHDGSSNLQEAIQSLVSLDNTALYDGAAKGVESLSQEPKPKAVIMFTDGGENDSVTYKANTLIAKANNEGVPIYTIGLGVGANTNLLTNLAVQTGGSFRYAPTAADMTAVYNAIAKEVRSRFVLGYRTHNTNFDGTLRTVTVNARGSTGTAVYRVNSTPQPALDPATQNLSHQSQPPGVALVIAGTLTDLDAQSGGQLLAGALYYRAAGGSAYSTVTLGLTSLGNGRYTFSATIPGGSVVYPGLYYYLRFTDGIQEVYLPFNYNTVPISISVLENHAPVISHTPLGMAIPGQSLTVTADITETDAGDSVSLAVAYYRIHDERQSMPYKSLSMQRGTGNTFTAVIPAGDVTDAGIDYYLSAWDTHAVRADSGTTSSPYYVPARGCRLLGTPSLADVGSHTVILAVSDGFGVVPQQFAITVPTVPPMITTLPQSQFAPLGGDVTFRVSATGNAPLSYQWFFNQTSLLANATSDTLFLTNVQPAQAGSYTVVISNSAGAVTSAPPAVLTVVIAPQLVSQPLSQTVWEGTNVSFSVMATGTPPFSYQWQFNGAILPGATGPLLLLTNVTKSLSGNYTAIVGNAAGSVTSSVAVLTVRSWGDVLNAPGVAWVSRGQARWFMQTNVTHDGDAAAQSGPIGDSTNSVLEATLMGPGSFSFWWKVSSEAGSDFLKFYLNGVEKAAIAGEVDWERKSFALPRGTVTVRWEYGKDFSFAEGADAGWVDQVEYQPVIPPTFLLQPTNLIARPGTSATFLTAADGSAPLGYQWYENGLVLADSLWISGTTTSNLLISSVQPAHEGDYWLVVTNLAGTATSQVVRLDLLIPPVITVPPASLTATAGTYVVLSVAAHSVVPLSYQWLFNTPGSASPTSNRPTKVPMSSGCPMRRERQIPRPPS
ncbi:MAG: VWA domain-containing protein [Verrucomicrobia bacterium]|nr:VWA domain-containing protein [Verrucomicrobiota bacterium]